MDLFSAVVLFLIGLICCVTLLVAGMIHSHRFTFGGSVLLLMVGMNGVVMVRDLFSLYAFIEVGASSFCSSPSTPPGTNWRGLQVLPDERFGHGHDAGRHRHPVSAGWGHTSFGAVSEYIRLRGGSIPLC